MTFSNERSDGGIRLWFRVGSLVVAGGLFLVAGSVAKGESITYEATDLSDVVVGKDLWRYSYRVSDFTFAVNQGFTIDFDQGLYEQLQSPPPSVNAGWDVLSLQPDLALNSDGLYDALALINAPGLGDSFTVTFIWLGAGIPGAQPFTVYDTNFAELLKGQTRLVPEPATAALVLAGLVALGCSRRRSPSSPPK